MIARYASVNAGAPKTGARKATELESERMPQGMTRRSKLRKQMVTRGASRARFAVAEVHALNAPTLIAVVV